ncbi:MAG: hypothetical protein ACXVPN_02605 [Bacteroidia bacterium]
MNQFFSIITTNWNFARWFRLALGVILLFEAAKSYDAFFGFLGAIFIMQAVFNAGCCGTQGCSASFTEKQMKTEAVEDVTYTEVK